MKEELLKILNVRLKFINENIEALEKMFKSLDVEKENIKYYEDILNIFRDNEKEYNIFKFDTIDKDKFENILSGLPDKIKDNFTKPGCTYEGLLYLIKGINTGISLSLTEVQANTLTDFVNAINDKRIENLAIAEGIELAKNDLECDDIDKLNDWKDCYSRIIARLQDNDYVTNIDEVISAIEFSNCDADKKYDLACYLLKYNSEVYDIKKLYKLDDEEPEEQEKDDDIDLSKPIQLEENNVDINNLDMDAINSVEENKEEVTTDEETEEYNDDSTVIPEANISLDEIPSYELGTPVDNEVPETTELPVENEVSEENDEVATVDIPVPVPEIPAENKVDEDFKDLVEKNEEPEVTNEVIPPVIPVEEPKVEVPEEKEENPGNEEEIKEIKKILGDYHVKTKEIDDEDYNTMTLDACKNILDYLKDNDLLNTFVKNTDLVVSLIKDNNLDNLKEAVEIVEKDLSVDKEDMQEILLSCVGSLPTIFITKDGNFNDFKENVNTFRELKIDLINLFDFSKEVFIYNHDMVLGNIELCKDYKFNITDKNAKYLLCLPYLEEKLDYFVEAVYKDTMKGGTGKTFDGVDIIEMYPNKLNCVTDETIKRLRYCSENGKKIFGSKEKSLAGEISNLKVDVINMPEDFTRSFFDNAFDTIDASEVEQYKGLIRNNRGYKKDEDFLIKKLDKYQKGERYSIEKLNISRNKVIRIYNILSSNGVDAMKALLFALCYNTIMTKEEYERMKAFANSLGGK